MCEDPRDVSTIISIQDRDGIEGNTETSRPLTLSNDMKTPVMYRPSFRFRTEMDSGQGQRQDRDGLEGNTETSRPLSLLNVTKH